MNLSEKSGCIAGWLMALAMKLPGAHQALRRLMLRDDHALLKEVALSSRRAPLESLLVENDHTVLKDLLARRGHAALKAVMLDGDPVWFAMIARARGGVPLAELLFREEGALLRHLCRLQGVETMEPWLRSLSTAERARLVEVLLLEGSPSIVEVLCRTPSLLQEIAELPRLQSMVALLDAWTRIRPLLPEEEPALKSRLADALKSIRTREHVRGRVLDIITEGEVVRFAEGALRFPCRHSLWTLIQEILVNESYYFNCESESPRIIDAGSHMGMAIYYFKSLYPSARITAFEPDPALYTLAAENVEKNDWTDVELLPFALAGKRQNAPFHISEAWSMAGSLNDRRARLGDKVRTITVQCVPLSDYLREPVDFLKLDIEGAEVEVLEEIADWLHHVSYFFCEFHQGGGSSSAGLARIVNLLEVAGFEVQVAKSSNFQATSEKRPFLHFDGAASTLIHARNRRLRGEPTLADSGNPP